MIFHVHTATPLLCKHSLWKTSELAHFFLLCPRKLDIITYAKPTKCFILLVPPQNLLSQRRRVQFWKRRGSWIYLWWLIHLCNVNVEEIIKIFFSKGFQFFIVDSYHGRPLKRRWRGLNVNSQNAVKHNKNDLLR